MPGANPEGLWFILVQGFGCHTKDTHIHTNHYINEMVLVSNCSIFNMILYPSVKLRFSSVFSVNLRPLTVKKKNLLSLFNVICNRDY